MTAPRGLVRCQVCHEYRGVVLNRDYEPLPATQGLGDYFIVLCICEGFHAAFVDDGSIFTTTGMKRAGYWLMRQINGRATNAAKRNMFALRAVSPVLI